MCIHMCVHHTGICTHQCTCTLMHTHTQSDVIICFNFGCGRFWSCKGKWRKVVWLWKTNATYSPRSTMNIVIKWHKRHNSINILSRSIYKSGFAFSHNGELNHNEISSSITDTTIGNYVAAQDTEDILMTY